MPVSIRIATPQDLKTVQDLNHQLFLSDIKNDPELIINWPYSEEGETYFRGILAGEYSVCFIAEDKGVAIGYLAGALRQKTTYRNCKMSELENMYVDSTRRSAGVGALLVQNFVEWSKKMHADSCVVDAYTPNTRAIEFYRRNGFGDYSTILERVI